MMSRLSVRYKRAVFFYLPETESESHESGTGGFSKVQKVLWWLHLCIQNAKIFFYVAIGSAAGRNSALTLSVQHSALDTSLLRDSQALVSLTPA